MSGVVGLSRSISGLPEIQSAIAMYGPDEMVLLSDLAIGKSETLFNFKFSGILRCADGLTTILRSPIEDASEPLLFLIFLNADASSDFCERLAVFAIAYEEFANYLFFHINTFDFININHFIYHKIIIILFCFMAAIFIEWHVTD